MDLILSFSLLAILDKSIEGKLYIYKLKQITQV
jgi:hypothetical protein